MIAIFLRAFLLVGYSPKKWIERLQLEVYALLKQNGSVLGVCSHFMDCTKVVKSAGASKVSSNHCVKKEKKSCEIRQVESTDLSHRLIYGEDSMRVTENHLSALLLSDC